MDDELYDRDRDPDDAPRVAYWVPEEAVRNLAMERALHSNETHVQTAKRILEENLPLATYSLVHMALNDQKPEIRLAAAKYIHDQAMGSPNRKEDIPVSGKHAWEKIHDAVLVDAGEIVGKRRPGRPRKED